MVVILQGPENWHVWISSICLANSEVWNLVNPSRDQKSASLSLPITPTYKDINSAAADENDLTLTEKSALNNLRAQFRNKLEKYKDQEVAFTKLRQHVASSVGNYEYLIVDEDSIAKQLAILSNNVKPTDEEYKQMISNRYHAALKAPLESTFWNWYLNWMLAYKTAKRLELPDANRICATRLVLRALGAIDPELPVRYEIKMEDLAQTGKPDWYKTLPEPLILCKRLAAHGDDLRSRKATGSANIWEVIYESQRSERRPSRKPLFLTQRRKCSEFTECNEQAYRDEVAKLRCYLCKGINGHRLEDYLKSWREMITESRRLGLSGISDPWLFFCFLEEISPIYPEFVFYWRTKESNKGDAECPESSSDALALTEIFERCFRRKVLGEIDTIFGFGPRSYDFKFYQPQAGNKAKPPEPAKAIMRTGSPKSPCLCGMRHFYTQCFYLVDDIRPTHWMPYTDVASKVLDSLKKPSIRARVVRAMEKQGTTTTMIPPKVLLPTTTSLE